MSLDRGMLKGRAPPRARAEKQSQRWFAGEGKSAAFPPGQERLAFEARSRPGSRRAGTTRYFARGLAESPLAATARRARSEAASGKRTRLCNLFGRRGWSCAELRDSR